MDSAASAGAQLVRDALCPTLHVFTSPDASSSLHRNHLPSFSALLSPFESSVDRIQVRSVSYTPTTLPRFPFACVERPLPPSFNAPPHPQPSSSTLPAPAQAGGAQPATPVTPFAYPSQTERDELFLDQLGASLSSSIPSLLSSATPPPTVTLSPVSLRPRPGDDSEGGGGGQFEKSGVREDEEKEWRGETPDELAPWYKEMRESVLKRREMVEWETFSWPVGCLLVLSTSSPDPLNTLSALWDLSSPSSLFSPSSYPPRGAFEAEQDGRHEWADGNVLRFVVLVHDFGLGGGREGWEDAQTLHDTIRKTYGLHTALLPLFSASPGGTHPQPPSSTATSLYAYLRPSPTSSASRADEGEVVGLGYNIPITAPPPSSSSPPSLTSNDPAAPSPAPAPPEAEAAMGSELSDADLTALAKFARELVGQSVVPWIERAVVVGNEQFISSRRSLGGRLFSAGRKYFGGSSSPAASDSAGNSRAGSPGIAGGTGGGGGGYNAVKGYYPSPSQLCSSRRLADLAFTLGDYKLAAQVYDAVAKEAKGDKAWRYYAGASRMLALSHLLLHPPSLPLPPPSSSSSPLTPFQLASLSPLPTSFDSVRSTLLFHSLLLSLPPSSPALNSSAASQTASQALLRTAEGLGEEVASAVLVEMAALAELGVGFGGGGTKMKGRKRKGAMWMVAAGVRYEKCGVKSLSRRCLAQASTLYRPPPSYLSFSFSTSEPPPVSLTSLSDPRLPAPSPSSSSSPANQLGSFTATRSYLSHSLGRQAYTVGDASSAVTHFLELLSPGSGGGEELDWLDDFTLAWEHLLSTTSPSPLATTTPEGAEKAGWSLPVRLFDAGKARVVVGSAEAAGAGTGAGEEGERGWMEMEKVMKEGEGWIGKGGKKPGRMEYRGGEREEAVVGELFHLEVPVSNPLEQAFLSLGGLTLETKAGGEGELQVVDGPWREVELAPGERRKILIPLLSRTLGSFTLLSLTYRFASLLPVRELLSSVRFSGPSRPLPGKPSVRKPLPLQVRVRAAVPVLSVQVSSEEADGEGKEGEGRGLPGKLFLGETKKVRLSMENKGEVEVGEVMVLCDKPEFARFLPASTSSSAIYTSPPSSSSSPTTTTTATIPNHLRLNAPTSLLPSSSDDDGGRTTLKLGEKLEFDVLVRGDAVGTVELRWLFAFRAAAAEGEGSSSPSECFTTRATHRLDVYPSLEVRYAARPSAREGAPFVLGIEAYNTGLPASDISITSISLVSPRWVLSLNPWTSWEDDIATPLGWQQGTTFFLSVDAAEGEGKKKDEAAEFTCRQVEALLSGKEVRKELPGGVEVRATSVSGSPATATDPLSPSLLSSLLQSYTIHRFRTLSTSFPLLNPTSQLPHLFPLLPSLSSAFLVVFYASPSLDTAGHVLVPLSGLGSTAAPADAPLRKVLDEAERTAGRGLYEESQREREMLLATFARSELGGGGGGGEGKDEAPVEVGVEVKQVVGHDFASGPCILPISFSLRNTSPTASLSYTLTLGSPSSPRGATLSGPLTHRGTLPPLSLSTLDSSKLWVPRAGVFKTGEFRLVVAVEGEEGGNSWVSEGAGREVRVRDTSAVSTRRGAALEQGQAAVVEVQG
ncbi:hypothetical protein JCM8547_006157 [Rhodosporidiobolus lusitaniae]